MHTLFFERVEFGRCKFDSGDAPMSVASGTIEFYVHINAFSFIKEICDKSGAIIDLFEPPLAMVVTQNIKGIEVRNAEGAAIENLAVTICGDRDEGYQLAVIGVSHEIYKREFPQLVKQYFEHDDI